MQSIATPESLFQTLTPLLSQNFLIRVQIRVRLFIKLQNPTPVQTPATIIDPTVIYPCFYLRNDCTDSCYCRNEKVTQIFDSDSGSGSERKTQNPAGVDSGNPDPVPLLVRTCTWTECSLAPYRVRTCTSQSVRLHRKYNLLSTPFEMYTEFNKKYPCTKETAARNPCNDRLGVLC